MYRTRQFHIKKNSRLYPYCKDLCSKSAGLYNRANFVIRQYATAVDSFDSMVTVPGTVTCSQKTVKNRILTFATGFYNEFL